MIRSVSELSFVRHSFIRLSARYFSGIPPNLNLKEASSVSQTLRGCGQVIFLSDTSQGATVLAGLTIGDPTLTVVAVGGGAWCTALSRVMLKKGDESTTHGLHAYNGVLVGATVSVFFGPCPLLTMAGVTVVGSTVAFALTRVMGAYYPLGPQWTFAFNAVAIGGLVTSKVVAPVTIAMPAAVEVVIAERVPEVSDLLFSPLTGVSQIFLVNSPTTGAVLLGAIAMRSPLAAVHAGIGAAIGTGVGIVVGADYTTIANGLWGFNPCLTSLSVAMFFPTLSVGQLALSTGGAVSTALLSTVIGPIVMNIFGTPAFTLPFCFAATATYGIGKAMKLK